MTNFQCFWIVAGLATVSVGLMSVTTCLNRIADSLHWIAKQTSEKP